MVLFIESTSKVPETPELILISVELKFAEETSGEIITTPDASEPEDGFITEIWPAKHFTDVEIKKENTKMYSKDFIMKKLLNLF